MARVVYVYVDTVFGFYGVFVSFCLFVWLVGFFWGEGVVLLFVCCYCVFFNCLVGCFSMNVWTPPVLSVLYACVLYFCICPCSARLSMFHMERRSTNTLITIITIIMDAEKLTYPL